MVTLVTGQLLLIIAAIVSGVVQIITHLRVTDIKTQQAANTDQITTVAKDTEAIKGHVNSEKTAADGRELALQQQVVILREMLADKKATAALLAQAVATRGRGPDLTTAIAPSADPAVLDRIESNTAATAAGVEKLATP